MSVKLTKEIINERLFFKGIQLVSDYTGSLSNSTFTCEVGHTWKGRPNNVLGKNGCPLCNNKKLSTDIINARLADRGICIIGSLKDTLTKSLFECHQGHQWEARVDSILNGTNCNVCSPGGFKSKLPAWEYVLKYESFLKFGITNDLERRLSEHRRNGTFEIVHSKYHTDGELAQQWEHLIKQKYSGKFITKSKFPNGWTETLPLTLLEEILT
jgi:hypothetical protein